MSILDEAKKVLKIESQALLAKIEDLNGQFTQSVELLLTCKGKVIVTGMGKSGQVGKKIASTLSSTGTPALFLHPAESSHGDLGVIDYDDIVIGISYGGASGELISVLNYVARKGIPLIAMTADPKSSLAQAARYCIDIKVNEEACPMGLAPTTSSTVTLALGDAIAMSLLKERGFKEENFAEFHPGGSLGRKLLTLVKDVMHGAEALPLVAPRTAMTKVISLMTAKEVRGVAGVVENKVLVGVVTDGDIRRRLEKNNEAFTESADELMSRNPKTIDMNEQAQKALFVMEQFQIQILFVVDKSSSDPKKPVGLLHFQDLLKAKIK